MIDDGSHEPAARPDMHTFTVQLSVTFSQRRQAHAYIDIWRTLHTRLYTQLHGRSTRCKESVSAARRHNLLYPFMSYGAGKINKYCLPDGLGDPKICLKCNTVADVWGFNMQSTYSIRSIIVCYISMALPCVVYVVDLGAHATPQTC